MYDWFFNCRKYTEKCSQSMDEPTPWQHRFLMWLRCLVCEDSKNFTRQLKVIREAVRKEILPDDARLENVHLSQDAGDRMKAVIFKEMDKSK